MAQMSEIIILFIIVSLVMFGEIKDDPNKITKLCTIHDWSRNFLNDELVCMHCNFRSKEYE